MSVLGKDRLAEAAPAEDAVNSVGKCSDLVATLVGYHGEGNGGLVVLSLGFLENGGRNIGKVGISDDIYCQDGQEDGRGMGHGQGKDLRATDDKDRVIAMTAGECLGKGCNPFGAVCCWARAATDDDVTSARQRA